MKLYNSVMTHSTENSAIKRFTDNMLRILSANPSIAYRFLKEHFMDSFSWTMVLLQTCGDSSVRMATSKLLSHLLIIVLNHEQIN